MEGFKHDPLRLGLTVFLLVCFLIQIAINGISGQPAYSAGIFLNTTGDISDKYILDITPAGATFSIWGVIYAWQAAWIIYHLTLLGRKMSAGYMYIDPEIVPLSVLIIYILSEFVNVAWLILWDRQFINAALAILFSIALTLYVSLFLLHRRLYKITPTLKAEGKTVDIWATRLLIHNGIAFYATWCTIATLLNLATVISYSSQPSIDQKIASTACLSILSAEIIVWFTLDIFFLDKYVRYTFSPYIVLVLALTGVLAKNWQPGQRNPIFTAVLLAVAAAALIVKLITLFWRHCKSPIHPVDFKSEKKVEPL